MSIDQQTGQQARLRGFGLAPVVAGIGGEQVSNSGPGLIVDYRWMVARIELTLVRNPTDIDRVREELVDVSARERFAAALGAFCCPDALCFESEPVDLSRITPAS